MPARYRPRPAVLCLAIAAVVFVATAVIGVVAAAPEDAFRYNIIRVTNTAPGDFPTVRFSVTDPTRGNAPYDILLDPQFRTPGVSRLAVLIGWNTRDYTNIGSGNTSGAAYPISIDALDMAIANGDGSFSVTSPVAIPAFVTGSGAAAIEGHPAADVDGDGVFETQVQERSVFRYFLVTGSAITARRRVVDIAKCRQCHVPHLSQHGNNRTDEPQVCAICHNPNQTDISNRTAGPETPVDFKHMIHAIHAAEERDTPFVVIGRGGTVRDFSGVVFPADLENCLNCHLDGTATTRATFELPLRASVLGTTVATRSSYGPPKVIDRDPANDLNITPIAAVCSACHDDRETRQHMINGGASFAVLQSAIDSGLVRERCVSCHGPGQEEDVRRVHLEDEEDEEGDD